jgi:hypothetical protein
MDEVVAVGAEAVQPDDRGVRMGAGFELDAVEEAGAWSAHFASGAKSWLRIRATRATVPVAMSEKHDTLKAALAGFIPRDRLIDDPLRLLAWGTDASFYRLIQKVVVVVDTEDEVVRLLGECFRQGTPVTFRAAGTSLSGQAVTDSVLMLLSDRWRRCEVGPGAGTITLQPGVIGAAANRRLAPFGRKIGLTRVDRRRDDRRHRANNASGMCCARRRTATARSSACASSWRTARCSTPATKRAAPPSPPGGPTSCGSSPRSARRPAAAPRWRSGSGTSSG